MGEQLDKSLKQGFLVEMEELSTFLVATIQELKDGISKVEYIFCKQLHPNFQAQCKFLEKIYVEVRRSAEDEWKGKVDDLQREKQRVLEENQSLKLEKGNMLEEHKKKIDQLQGERKGKQLETEELEQKVEHMCLQLVEKNRLQRELSKLIQKKTSSIATKEKQLNGLQEKLKEKEEVVVQKKMLVGNLFRKIEAQASEMAEKEQLMNDCRKEKNILLVKLKDSEENACRLQLEHMQNTEEVEGQKVQKQLKECENEKVLLLATIKDLEENENDLKLKLRDRTDKYKKVKSQNNYLLRKCGLSIEGLLQCKKEDEFDSLAHNQNIKTSPNLKANTQDTSMAVYYRDKVKKEYLEDEKQVNVPNSPIVGALDFKAKTPNASMAVSDSDQVKKENLKDGKQAKTIVTSMAVSDKDVKKVNLEDENRSKTVHTSTSHPITPRFPVTHKRPLDAKSSPATGSKRPAPVWRDTRSHQARAGRDPHDDFLDTPLEKIKEDWNIKRYPHDLPPSMASKDVNMDGSDDETQETGFDQRPQKQQTVVPMAGNNKGFKFVEPVRKKAERENLKGVECKQCKRFYDAVLPNDGCDKRSLRCEHHDGVSRHRYRYVPPLTPDGFWNIGFESEM